MWLTARRPRLFDVKLRFVDICEHLAEALEAPLVNPADGCEDCLQIGGWWLHLRQCMACGRVGCCDESPNRHATAHFGASGHPVIRSIEPGETWIWCFRDGDVADLPGDSGDAGPTA